MKEVLLAKHSADGHTSNTFTSSRMQMRYLVRTYAKKGYVLTKIYVLMGGYVMSFGRKRYTYVSGSGYCLHHDITAPNTVEIQ